MNVAVFFGGKSCEHSISVITAVQAMRALDIRHKVFPIYIAQDGGFFALKSKSPSSFLDKKNLIGGKRVFFCPGKSVLYLKDGIVKKRLDIDVALLCNHGVNGEDGTLQGLLELCNIPYSGSGVCASAVGLDKGMMKEVFLANGLNVLPYLRISFDEYKNALFSVADKIKQKLRFPLIVKPASLGSSIGIGVAKDFEELYVRLDGAFEWDNSVVVENALSDFKELNCAVLGLDGDLIASSVESPLGWKDFLTFEDKYISKSTAKQREFPAKISSEIKSKVQLNAKKAFSCLGCSGVARVDFMLKDDELYVNEINTIPGALSNYLFIKCEEVSFDSVNDNSHDKTSTDINPAPSDLNGSKICEGIEFCALLDRLIMIAIENKKRKDRLNYRFNPTFALTGKGESLK